MSDPLTPGSPTLARARRRTSVYMPDLAFVIDDESFDIRCGFAIPESFPV